MAYEIARFLHFIGLTLIGAGLIGVFVCDLRTRQVTNLTAFAEAVRGIALFYDGLVVPGALLLGGTGTWMIIVWYDGWAFLSVPWLSGMVALFLFEFVEGNTVTRLYFMRLLRLTREASAAGGMTPALAKARDEGVPTFTHFLDLPILMVIVSLGVFRPETWSHFLVATLMAVAVATALTLWLPRLYRRASEMKRDTIATTATTRP